MLLNIIFFGYRQVLSSLQV